MKYRIRQKYVIVNTGIKDSDRDIVDIPDDAICIKFKQIDHGFNVIWLEPVEEMLC